eukprot:Gb_02807 [translate_table: standard]
MGPSALGRSEAYLHTIFPSNSIPVLETVANLGLLFFLFLVGLELDFKAIRRTGRKALATAAAGISLPFIGGICVAYVLKARISKGLGYGQFLVFMGVSLSVTAFPVLARILAELKLLTTDVGQTAMAAAAVNDVVAWVLLALAVALSGTDKSPVISVWVLLCGVAFVVFMMAVVKPAMTWMAHRSPDNNEPVNESYVCITLVGVLAAGFATDAIGIHSIFGAFVFGLTIPKDGPFAGMLTEKIEDFVSGLLLPLYFASSGLKTNVATIHGSQSWGATWGSNDPGIPDEHQRIGGANCLEHWERQEVLNDEVFAILVIMALFTTFITTPIVTAINKPARKPVPYKDRKIERDKAENELRIVACLHGTRSIPAIINLIEASRGIGKPALRLYIMRLVELSERSSAIMMVHKSKKNGRPCWNHNRGEGDQIAAVAFEAYEQLSKVAVRPMTAISAFRDMHEDICNIAHQKRAAMIILPFHKYQRVDGVLECVNMGFRTVNLKVLRHSPCSVGILVDRGLGGRSQLAPTNISLYVVVLFFGGPDDREALAFGRRMAEHPGIGLTVFRFLPGREFNHTAIDLTPLPPQDHDREEHPQVFKFSTAEMDREKEKCLDENALADTNDDDGGESIVYEEMLIRNGNTVDSVLSIAKTNKFNLLLVGRGRFPSLLVADLADRCAECPELGPIGDVLACSGASINASVLVIQQHDVIHTPEAPLSKNSRLHDALHQIA